MGYYEWIQPSVNAQREEEDMEERNMAGALEVLLSHTTTAADISTAPSETSPVKG